MQFIIQESFNILDVLDILIVPVVLAILAILMPGYLEKVKSKHRARTFIKLICAELKQLAPKDPFKKTEQSIWTDHLRERFIHEEIFKNPSENRDFLLSLDPKLTYNLSQLWINFEKAADMKKKKKDQDDKLKNEDFEKIGYHGVQWCKFLKKIYSYLEKSDIKSVSGECSTEENTIYTNIYIDWENLIKFYREAEKELKAGSDNA